MSGIAIAPMQTSGTIAASRVLTRSRRMLVLLSGIIILSLADLIVTLTHLRSTGMAEANPIARFVIGASGSPISLVCFKTLSVLICVLLLYKVRRTLQGEIAAWCALMILSLLSVIWFSYTRYYEDPIKLQLAQSQLNDDTWVRLD